MRTYKVYRLHNMPEGEEEQNAAIDATFTTQFGHMHDVGAYYLVVRTEVVMDGPLKVEEVTVEDEPYLWSDLTAAFEENR